MVKFNTALVAGAALCIVGAAAAPQSWTGAGCPSTCTAAYQAINGCGNNGNSCLCSTSSNLVQEMVKQCLICDGSAKLLSTDQRTYLQGLQDTCNAQLATATKSGSGMSINLGNNQGSISIGGGASRSSVSASPTPTSRTSSPAGQGSTINVGPAGTVSVANNTGSLVINFGSPSATPSSGARKQGVISATGLLGVISGLVAFAF